MILQGKKDGEAAVNVDAENTLGGELGWGVRGCRWF